MKKISREYLKKMMSMDNEQLNRSLKKLEKEGLIKLDKNNEIIYVTPPIAGGVR